MEKVVPNPRNPNQHPAAQVALLAKVIAHQGWRSPIVVSTRSGFIVSDHGRYEAAKLLKVSAVPVDCQDFATDADEWAHLVADNRLAELAEADGAALKELLSEACLKHDGIVLALASADDLSNARHKNVHCSHRPAVGVLLHVKRLDPLRIVRHDDRTARDLLCQIPFVLGLQIQAEAHRKSTASPEPSSLATA